tara:strand:+ start:6139 stop:6801 length:663 start_codon:yes stop_codon:yes gene_type:complete
MKKILPISILSLLSSCSTLDVNSIAPGYVEAYKAINNVIFGFDDLEIDKDQIANIPYASALLKIGKGPQGLIILESKRNQNLTWVSADGVYFVISHGRIIKTVGLNNNLTDISLPSRINRKSLKSIEGVSEHYYYYSYDKPLLRNLEIKAKITIYEESIEELKFGPKSLTLITEDISNETLGWKFQNKYWIDDQGFVWKSIQKISPKVPEIYIEITKKPS